MALGFVKRADILALDGNELGSSVFCSWFDADEVYDWVWIGTNCRWTLDPDFWTLSDDKTDNEEENNNIKKMTETHSYPFKRWFKKSDTTTGLN